MGVKFVENGLMFDDALIVPRRSSVYSRKDVSLGTWLVGDLTLELPTISANMNAVMLEAGAHAVYAGVGLSAV
jgi:IMP dehydrogenase